MKAEQFKLLYKILLGIGILITKGIDNEDKISRWNYNRLKKMRIDYFDTLTEFFENVHGIPLDAEEVDCLANYVLEPTMAFKNVTSVLHFFASIMKQPSFYPILIMEYTKIVDNLTPLHLCFEYLNSKECIGNTRTKILEGILSMLTFPDESLKVPAYKTSISLKNIEANYGTRILLQYFDSIIKFLRAAMPSDAAEARKLPAIYLDILSQLSSYVDDPTIGDHFATLLLIYVEKGKIKNESKIKSILRGISKLTRYVKDGRLYLK